MPDDRSSAGRSAPADSFPDVETRIWLRILSLHGDIHARLNRALGAGFGLSLAKFDVLAQLDRFGGCLSQGQLTQHLKVTGGNVSGLVQRLAADGLISKEMSSTDRRSFVVRLTAKGRSVFAAARRTHRQQLDESFARVPAAELEAALQVLTDLCATTTNKALGDR